MTKMEYNKEESNEKTNYGSCENVMSVIRRLIPFRTD